MERFERGTQVESYYITHMRKTEDNTENLKKQNNHIKKKYKRTKFLPLYFLTFESKGFKQPY